jgi:aminopeptidase N
MMIFDVWAARGGPYIKTKKINMKKLFLFIVLLWTSTVLFPQVDVYDSGGALMPEQAAYDVTHYDLSVQVFPDKKAIEGTVVVTADVVNPMKWLVLDLDPLLEISGVEELKEGINQQRSFNRKGGKVWINLGKKRKEGEHIQVAVRYGGQPRVAPNPPWDGGFQWESTASGAPWIATSCQTNGADVWWPVKDHVSDEPSTMDLRIRVPEQLFVATNGRLEEIKRHEDKTSTYHWHLNNPINVYNVALNIAPYEIIENELNSVAGEKVPVFFYVLPEDLAKGKKLMKQIIEHLEFYEKYLGPYPFRSDKYGVAQTPHLGMEHQTIIAYGAGFSNNSMTRGTDWGFDALHHHELGHEWWGNLVTNADWKDMWIHEGFCTYMQAVYMEELEGKEGYHRYMDNMRGFGNSLAIAPKKVQSAQEIYQAPIYSKGAWVLHNLRFVMGDEAFFTALRRFCYPTPEMEKVTDGSQTRFVDTQDFIDLCEDISGKELDWFFDVYVRQPALPKLMSGVVDGQLSLKWETPVEVDFPMPVEVKINGQTRKYEVPESGLRIPVKKGAKVEVDPNNWVLYEEKKE